MIALSVFVALAACPAPAQDPGQQSTGDAVADAARKARAEQKTAPKPKKVITNDDMPSAPAPAQAATGKGSSEGAATDPGSDKDEENNPKSEKYWRNRFAKLRGKLSNAEQELDVLQRELNKDELQYYNDPQKALMQQHNRSDINDKTAKLDAKKKEVESLKQQLSDLEDELRKAGGDPGWAR